MSASGRVCEITNGRFVEAKHEKRWLAVRLLRSNPAGRFGSDSILGFATRTSGTSTKLTTRAERHSCSASLPLGSPYPPALDAHESPRAYHESSFVDVSDGGPPKLSGR